MGSTPTTATVDQVLLSPRRITASTEFTKQLLLQSSVDVEDFIRADLMKAIAVKLDQLALTGNGAGSDPTGILGTQSVGWSNFPAPRRGRKFSVSRLRWRGPT